MTGIVTRITRIITNNWDFIYLLNIRKLYWYNVLQDNFLVCRYNGDDNGTIVGIYFSEYHTLPIR